MKTIKKISALTNVLITALIIKDEFYLTNALLLPGLEILISFSFFLWYIIIAPSDVLIEVSSWFMKAWDFFYDPQYVGAAWRRSFVNPFKQDSECLLPCEGTCCDDPCVFPRFLRKRSKNLRLHFPCMLLKLSESVQGTLEIWVLVEGPNEFSVILLRSKGPPIFFSCVRKRVNISNINTQS